jgi:hypothetical protein
MAACITATGGRMAHECKPFHVDGRRMWFHLQTDTSNVLIEKKARAVCWTSTTDDEEEGVGPRQAVPGAHMRVELRHHNKVDFRHADGVDFQEVFVMAVPSFPATAFAQLVLPSGEAVNLEAPA